MTSEQTQGAVSVTSTKPVRQPVMPEIAVGADASAFRASRPLPETGSPSGLPHASDPVARTLKQVSVAATEDEMHDAVARFLREQAQALLVAWAVPESDEPDCEVRLQGLICPMEGISATLRTQLKQHGLQALRQGSRTEFSIGPPTESEKRPYLVLTAVPILLQRRECLILVQEYGGPPAGSRSASETPRTPAELRTAVDLAELMIRNWIATHSGARTSGTKSPVPIDDPPGIAAQTAAIIEIMARVQTTAEPTEACQRLADSLQQHLSCRCVHVGLCRRGGMDCRLQAISGQPEVDRLQEGVRLSEAVLQESLARSAASVWPVPDGQPRHALLAHQQFCEQESCSAVVSIPLLAPDHERVGAVLIVLNGSVAETEPTTRFLTAAAPALSSCLQVIQKLADSRFLQLARTLRRWWTGQRRRTVAAVCAVAVAAMLVPLPYRIACECELQPVERRFAAVPFDGAIEECLVEPGDLVDADQLLARMDGREVHWEHAGVQADLNKATKERNTHLNRKEFGDAAILQHEMQRLQNRSDLLSHRDDNLDIRSPIRGVIVSGDHREDVGVPLKTGETLFEVAPLDRMVIEVCIPEEDVRHVQEGMTIRLQLNAIPERPVEAVIRSVHPGAELRDNENVFLAEAEISNQDLMLRPGMRGTGRLTTGRRMLGWILFHKPVSWCAGRLGL